MGWCSRGIKPFLPENTEALLWGQTFQRQFAFHQRRIQDLELACGAVAGQHLASAIRVKTRKSRLRMRWTATDLAKVQQSGRLELLQHQHHVAGFRAGFTRLHSVPA